MCVFACVCREDRERERSAVCCAPCAIKGGVARALSRRPILPDTRQAETHAALRAEAKQEDALFKAAAKRKLKDVEGKRKKEVEQENARIGADNLVASDKKPLVKYRPLFAPNDIEVMGTHPCLLKNFRSWENPVSRSGRGWLHGRGKWQPS